MNYIKQINAFWEKERELKGVDSQIQSYYFAMLYFANKYGFEFALYREDVMEQAKLAKNTYYKVRQTAKDLGLVDFEEGTNKRTKCAFRVKQLYQICDTTKDTTSDTTKDSACDTPCDHTDKLLNYKTKKQKEVIISSYPFEDFWEGYGKKKGKKAEAEKIWSKLKEAEKEQIFKGLKNYSQSFKDKQYQPYPTSFLNGRFWENEGYCDVVNKEGKKIIGYSPIMDISWEKGFAEQVQVGERPIFEGEKIPFSMRATA